MSPRAVIGQSGRRARPTQGGLPGHAIAPPVPAARRSLPHPRSSCHIRRASHRLDAAHHRHPRRTPRCCSTGLDLAGKPPLRATANNPFYVNARLGIAHPEWLAACGLQAGDRLHTAGAQSSSYSYNGDGTLVGQASGGVTTGYAQDLAGGQRVPAHGW